MYRRCLSIVYWCFLLVHHTVQSEFILSFKPSSTDLAVAENKTVTVLLSNSNLTFPVTVDFLYDGKLQPDRVFIDTIPSITFNQSSSDDQSREIRFVGRHQGHLVLSAQSAQTNASSSIGFLLIDIARSHVLSIFIQIVGWIYFFAWSISFYPQIFLNFKRRSVIGLNFDFLALNIIGHSCYSVFNLYLYTSHDVQQQYYEKHPHGVLPVLLNDVSLSSVFPAID